MNNPIKTLTFPGDKSIAHRLVLLSLLVNKKILIKNLPDSQDVCSSLDIVKTLGVEVSKIEDSKTVELKPLNKKDFGKEEIVLDCGNSGTTARLLCGILANLKGKYKLIGDESLSKRPMERVVRPLADLMGVNISSTDGHLPIYIEANGKTKAADFFNQTGSAQVKSAVLFAGLAAEGETVVREQFLSRDHTERLLDYLLFTQQYGGQSACSTLFSSAVSEDNSLRINSEGTSLVRRIEGLSSAARNSSSENSQNTWQKICANGGQSACSTLFSSAVSEDNSLRINSEGTSLVRRIEGLSSAARNSSSENSQNTWQKICADGGQSACSTLFSSAIPQVNRLCEPKAWQANISDDRLNFSIPGDISSAAYFIVWGAITGKKLEIENVLLNPTRTGFISVLRRMGAEIEVQIKEDIWEPIGDIFVKGGNLKSTDIQADEIPSLIDELPILAVAMAFAKGKSRVSGASELRVKESDRISCLISQLKKAGINCCEYEDGYEICGENKIISTELESFNDHRLAMSFAILSKCSKADIKVKDRDSVRISFPEFYNYLENNN